MSKRLYDLVAKVLNVPADLINDDSGPESIENWSSFKGYVLLYELESEFKVKFTIDEAMDVKKVADIKRHLANHGITL
ncbi:MAG: acyl carrier protein [Nitrosopumilaceae archaeon]|nr:acyl carrier protein [Nitrososphaeria archaeon]NDB52172.1 acyl carrier protein [Nitrosopumilaceae archaeon]NDB89188.1 acyl carrier protein [Nitrososphaerota archaeon]NDB91066.1 acyl carrier protein [Nitrososphaerota archaeon]NDB92860.1 acyl carrier protein [Nitrososphaeria archaeon]